MKIKNLTKFVNNNNSNLKEYFISEIKNSKKINKNIRIEILKNLDINYYRYNVDNTKYSAFFEKGTYLYLRILNNILVITLYYSICTGDCIYIVEDKHLKQIRINNL